MLILPVLLLLAAAQPEAATIPPLPDISPLTPIASPDPTAPSPSPPPPSAPAASAASTPGLAIAGLAFGSEDIESATQQWDDYAGEWILVLSFSDTGRSKFTALQRGRLGDALEIRLDGELVASPYLQEPIEGGVMAISGGFTEAEATALAERLGRLPPAPEATEAPLPATSSGPPIPGLSIAAIPFGPDDIASADQEFDPLTGEMIVHLTFTEAGHRKFRALQQDRVGQVLEIRVDGELVSDPVLLEPIEGTEVTIAGNFIVEAAAAPAEQQGGTPPSD